jgi:hypothetical protein
MPGWATPTHAHGTQTIPAATAAEPLQQSDTAHNDADAAFGLEGDHWWALPFGPENDIFADLFPGDHDLQTFGYMGNGLMSFP